MVVLATLTGWSNINGTGKSLNNQIQGNLGTNVLTGGGGADTFVFTGPNSALLPFDTIADFSRVTGGRDFIDLTAIDANSLVAGDQAFTLIGDLSLNPFSGAGQLGYLVFSSISKIRVIGEIDGIDLGGDFAVDLNLTGSMGSSDFLL